MEMEMAFSIKGMETVTKMEIRMSESLMVRVHFKFFLQRLITT